MNSLRFVRCIIFNVLFCSLIQHHSIAEVSNVDPAEREIWQVGFGKQDVTPTEPTRLSGYSSRIESHLSVSDTLNARVMAISPAGSSINADAVILVSIDSIAVTSVMTVNLSAWLEKKYGIPRRSLAVSITHSHAAPHVAGGLNNLFQIPSRPDQAEATKRYTDQMIDAIQQAIVQAMDARSPAKLAIGDGEAKFAVQRRLLKEGKWINFGERSSGPVDSRVRVMQATSVDGKLLGAAFLYACHCTTLGPDFNNISGDWAGMAASRLEQVHDDAIFLPIIGCGADANPGPRGSYEFAQQHAAEMADSVNAVLNRKDLVKLESFPKTHFGYAGLAPEQPTPEHVQKMAKSEKPNEKNWGESMIAIRKQMGRLPETYPMPIHTWQFGDELTWVFLGGEVVVDYQFQIEKELTTKATWVAAYTDDVFAYVASEQMRSEGGYEVDFSMVFYLQPGRWQSGTQSLVVRRVREIVDQPIAEERPLNAEEALASIRVPDGFRVELVASEPLIQDPINLAFGADGRVWVVEMADYPLGVNGGGRVKWLEDTDHDGRMDKSHLFLDELAYPTSVMPWKDGVIVIAAPDVFFATDGDGDGKAEIREPLLTGIHEANPQHRASGFEWGLDGWVHLTVGEGTKQLTSSRNGQSYDVGGRDVAWNPTTGDIRTTSGQTQFVRSRDAFGNWFGNSNSEPMFHYVIEERYLQHNSVAGERKHHLLTPGIAPPVLPRSRTVDRFNDLFAYNRFTSACSSTVSRVPGLSTSMDTNNPVALICEPVHNLVARIEIADDGSTFSASRHPADQGFDFFTSTDPWSRPVRVVNAPDGTIWIVDMVRRVIEHPEWIPTAWQERIDLRGGSDLGRIYRVYHESHKPLSSVGLAVDSDRVLAAIASDNDGLRGLARQRLMEGDFSDLQRQLRRLAVEDTSPTVRASAFGCLVQKSWFTPADLLVALSDSDPRVVRLGLEFSESWSDKFSPSNSDSKEQAPIFDALLRVPSRALGPQVDLQWVLTSTLFPQLDAADSLALIAARSARDVWIVKALSLVNGDENAFLAAKGLLNAFATDDEVSTDAFASLENTLLVLWKKSPAKLRTELALARLPKLNQNDDHAFSPTELLLLSVVAQSNESNDVDRKSLEQLSARTRERMLSDAVEENECIALINLIGCGLATEEQEAKDASRLIAADRSTRIRHAAIEVLRRLKTKDVASVLIDAWSGLTVQERSKACATLLTRSTWLTELAAALDSNKVHVNELDLATVQQLRSLPNSSLRGQFAQRFGKPTERGTVVAKYLDGLTVAPASADGEKLYRDHCVVCHQINEGKPQLGPTLQNLGHWTLDQWVTAIMNPNQAVEPKYLQSTVSTVDGRVMSGIVQERSSQSLRLAASDGSILELALSDVEDIRESGVSLMPEGFETKLSTDQFSQLIAYLRSAATSKSQ